MLVHNTCNSNVSCMLIQKECMSEQSNLTHWYKHLYLLTNINQLRSINDDYLPFRPICLLNLESILSFPVHVLRPMITSWSMITSVISAAAIITVTTTAAEITAAVSLAEMALLTDSGPLSDVAVV